MIKINQEDETTKKMENGNRNLDRNLSNYHNHIPAVRQAVNDHQSFAIKNLVPHAGCCSTNGFCFDSAASEIIGKLVEEMIRS